MRHTKTQIISLLFLFVIVGLTGFIITANRQQKTYRSKAEEIISPTPEASPSAQIALLEVELESKNSGLITLLEEYELGDETKKQNIVSVLETNLAERNKNQISLLALSPLSVYNKAFSKDMLDKLQAAGQIKEKQLVEERVDIKGKIIKVHIDNFTQNTSHEEFIFTEDKNPNENIRLYPLDSNLNLISGSEIHITDGIKIKELEEELTSGYSPFTSFAYAQERIPLNSKKYTLLEAISQFNLCLNCHN